MAIKLKTGNEIKDIDLASANPLKQIKVLSTGATVWAANRNVTFNWNTTTVNQIKYRVGNSGAWLDAEQGKTYEVAVGETVYAYAIPTDGYIDAAPNSDAWSVVGPTPEGIDQKVYKATISDKDLTVTFSAVLTPHTLHIGELVGISSVSVVRTSPEESKGTLVDGSTIYRGDLLIITYNPATGFDIDTAEKTVSITLDVDYTVPKPDDSQNLHRKTYSISLGYTSEAGLSGQWKVAGVVGNTVSAKYLDTLTFEANESTHSALMTVVDYETGATTATAELSYEDDPAINEKLTTTELPSSMPAKNVEFTATTKSAGSTEYSCYLTLDEGIKSTDVQIDGGTKTTYTGSAGILIGAGSKVSVIPTAKDGYTASKTLIEFTMPAKEYTQEITSTINTQTITFSVVEGTGTWYSKSGDNWIAKGSSYSTTCHYNDVISRSADIITISCVHTVATLEEIKFVPDEISEAAWTTAYTIGTQSLSDGGSVTITENKDIKVSVTYIMDSITFTFNYNVGISEIWYKLSTETDYTKLTKTGTATTKVFSSGTIINAYAVASTGYTTQYTSTNPKTITVSSTNKVFDSTTTADLRTVVINCSLGTLTVDETASGKTATLDCYYNDVITSKDNVIYIYKADSTTVRYKLTYNIPVETGYDITYDITVKSPITENQTINITEAKTEKEYNFTINSNLDVSTITYYIDDGDYQYFCPTSDKKSVTFKVAYTHTVTAWGIPNTGKSCYYDSDNKYTTTMQASDDDVTIGGASSSCSITLKADSTLQTNCPAKWMLTSESTGTQGSAVTLYDSFKYGTTYSVDNTNHLVTIGNKIYSLLDPAAITTGYEISDRTITVVDAYANAMANSGQITDTCTFKAFITEKLIKKTFSWKINTGIASIVYKLGDADPVTVTTDGSIQADYNTVITVYGLSKSGYNAPQYSQANPLTFNLTTDKSFEPTATLASVTVTLGSIAGYGGTWYDVIDSSDGSIIDHFTAKTQDGWSRTDNIIKFTRNGTTYRTIKLAPTYITGYSNSVTYTYAYTGKSAEDMPTTGSVLGDMTIYADNEPAGADQYPVQFSLGTGIASVTYKVNGGTAKTITATQTINISYGSTVTAWATASKNYKTPNNYSEATAKSITVSIRGNALSFTTTPVDVAVTFAAEEGYWTATDSTGLSALYFTVSYGTAWSLSNNVITISGYGKWTYTKAEKTGVDTSYRIDYSSESPITTETTFTGVTVSTVKQYNLTLKGDSNHITAMYYKINNGSWTKYTDTVKVTYGASVYTYATPKAGYSTQYDSESNYYTITTNCQGDVGFTYTTEQQYRTIVFTTAGCGGTWATDSSDQLPGATSCSVPYGSTIAISGSTVTVSSTTGVIYTYTFTVPTSTKSESYKLDSITSSATTVIDTITVTATTSSQDIKYNLTLNPGSGVCIHYNINSAGWQTITKSVTLSVKVGSSIVVYGSSTDTTKYDEPTINESSPATITMPAYDDTIGISTTRKSYKVTFVTPSVGGSWTCDSSSINIDSYYVKYGSTISVSGNTATVDGTPITYNKPTAPTGHTYSSSVSTSAVAVIGNTTITATVTDDTIKYSIILSGTSHVTKIYYSIDGGSTYSEYTQELQVAYGTAFRAYPICATGYECIYSASNPYKQIITGKDAIGFNSTAIHYSVTFATSGGGSWSWDSTEGGSTKPSIAYGTAVNVSGNVVTLAGYGTWTYTKPTNTESTEYTFAGISNATGTITADRTITGSATSSTRKYTFTIVRDDTTVGTIHYSFDGGSTWGTQTATRVEYSVNFGASIKIYADAVTGYQPYYDSASNCWSNTKSSSNSQQISMNGYAKSYKVTFKVEGGYGGSWTADSTSPAITNCTATYGMACGYNSNKVYIGYWSHWIYTFTKPADTWQYSYSYSISVPVTTITGDTTITATVTRTLKTYTVTVSNTPELVTEMQYKIGSGNWTVLGSQRSFTVSAGSSFYVACTACTTGYYITAWTKDSPNTIDSVKSNYNINMASNDVCVLKKVIITLVSSNTSYASWTTDSSVYVANTSLAVSYGAWISINPVGTPEEIAAKRCSKWQVLVNGKQDANATLSVGEYQYQTNPGTTETPKYDKQCYYATINYSSGYAYDDFTITANVQK